MKATRDNWFQKQWIKLKNLYRLWTMESDPIPTTDYDEVFERIYTSPSGIDYRLSIDDEYLPTAQAFSYVTYKPLSNKKASSAMTLTQANTTGVKRLEPGMRFDKLELKTVNDLGEEFCIVFTNVEVLKTNFDISIDDLMTQFVHTLVGEYQSNKMRFGAK